jgi:hypothetical protein
VTAFSPAVKGRVRGHFLAKGYGFPRSTQQCLAVLHHQPIRYAQQPGASRSELAFLRRVHPRQARSRANRSVKFDGQTMFEAIEDDPVSARAWAAGLCAQPSARQEVRRRSFGVGLVAPQFTSVLGRDAHRASMAGLS